jgi:hypothetical protein
MLYNADILFFANCFLVELGIRHAPEPKTLLSLEEEHLTN